MQSQQINGLRPLELLRKTQYFDGPTSWFKYEELFDDWLDFSQLEAGKRGPALKNRLVGDGSNEQRTSRPRISQSRRWSQVFQGYLRHHFIKGAQSVSSWKFFQFIRSQSDNAEMVKWIGKMFTAPEAFEICSDGHVADVFHERNPKTKSVSC